MFVPAGGIGSRLRERVSGVPKSMAPVGGKPFLELLLEFWVDRGISEFIVGTGYLADQIEDYFGPRFLSATLVYSREKNPVGTGGSLALAVQRGLVGEDLLISNGDTILDAPLAEMFRSAHSPGTDAVVAVRKIRKLEGRYGYFAISGGIVDKVIPASRRPEVAAAEASLRLNTGVLKLNSSAIDFVRQDCLNLLGGASLELDVVSRMIAADYCVRTVDTSGYFCDIGIPDDYERFCRDSVAGRVPR